VFNLPAVILVDIGLASVVLGAASLLRPLRVLGIHSREAGMWVCLAGVAIVIAGMLLPAPVARVAAVRSDLDRALPAWQFRERHRTHVNASPESVDRAIRAVSADDIRLFRTLTWIRSPRFRQTGGGNILSPPGGSVPILEVALRTGFIAVSDRPAREIVIGSIVAGPVRTLRGERTAENFISLAAPGFAKAAMSFAIEPDKAGGSTVTTETRVYATDSGAARRFAAYWRVIYPGSSLIRYMWLRAIGNNAEGRSGG
jgi:hypothetical protein